MDKLWSALSAIGGFATIGLILDLALRQAEEAKLRDWMTRWWASFDSVKWSNFGRAEAQRAVAIMDRWAGAGLWTSRRWKVAAVVMTIWLIVGFLYLSVRLIFAEVQGASYWAKFGHYWAVPRLLIADIWMLASVLVFFALSISVFRILAQATARLNPVGLLGLLFFVAILFVQFLLLLYWSGFVMVIAVVLPGAIMDGVLYQGWDLELILDMVSGIQVFSVDAQLKEVFAPFLPLPRLQDPMTKQWIDGWAYKDIGGIAKSGLDLTSNGLRIGFSLLFLSSYLFGSFLQPVASRIWAGLIEKKKPIFATLFGIIGGIWSFASTLMK